MAVSWDGDLSYNKVTFDPLVKSELKGDPVKDDASLTTKYVKWTLSTTSWVTGATGPSDAVMDDLATRLTTRGKRLTYTDRGGPTFDVNDGATGRQQDVCAGPVPRLISIDHIGGNRTALVKWEVDFCLPMCNDALFRLALMQLNYTVNYERDQDGWTTRRVVISAEIPQQVRDNGSLVDSIDNYFEDILPAPLLDFSRRTSMSIAPNKARCELTVEDVENPVTLPTYTTAAPLKWRVSSKLQGQGFVQWNASLSGSVRIKAGYPRGQAWSAFLLTLESRLRDINQRPEADRPRPNLPGTNIPIPGGAPGLNYLLTSCSIEEDVYGKDSSFSVELVIFQSSLEKIIRDSGMWRQIRGTDRIFWSLQRPGPRGNAGLRHREGEIVVDLCRRRRGQDGIRGMFEQAGRPPRRDVISGFPPERAPRRPGRMDPARSWLGWWSDIEILEDNHLARHRPIGGPVQEMGLQFPVAGTPESVGRIVVPNLPPERTTVPDIIQQIGNPEYVVILRGNAVRADHRINHPRVLTIGGVPARQARRSFRHGLVSQVGPVPIYAAVWEIVYYLERPPTGPMPEPSNPFLGTQGQR